MNLKITLIGGAAMCCALTAGAAQARTHHRQAPSERAMQAEIDALKAQVNALEQRLDAQSAAQQQAVASNAAQLQAAQSTAQSAKASADKAQTELAAQGAKIDTIPAVVETAARAQAPKPGWWNDTKVGGTVFADLSYIGAKNDGRSNAQSGTDFDVTRAYLTIDHRFSDVFSANLTTDFTYDSTTKATQLYLKKAYLQARLAGDALTVRAGGADLPWVPFVENLYGHRYVEHVMADLDGFGTSADWGVHVLGKLWSGRLGYQVSLVDGQGYKTPAITNVNRTGAMDVEGRVNANIGHFVVAVGGYDGKLGHKLTGVPTFHTARRFDAVAGYVDSRFRAGVEYMYARYWSDVTQPNPNRTNSAVGVSAFGSINLNRKVNVFGRYDWLKPRSDTAPNFTSNYYNIGIGYEPIAPIDIALVYKHDSVLDGLLSTSNGQIGTLTSPALGKGTFDAVGLFTQWKF